MSINIRDSVLLFR